MNFLVIGTGLLGRERINVLRRLRDDGFDIDRIYAYDSRSQDSSLKVEYVEKEKITDLDIDWAIIAVPHNFASEYIKLVAPMGCKILLEKPMGRSLEEAEEIYNAMIFPEQIFMGFNYRFYRGVRSLAEDIRDNAFGNLVGIDITLGHGGKPEDASNWQVSPTGCGRNSLLDPGIHMLDLINWFYPDRAIPLYGREWRGSWNTGIGEENHLLLDINGAVVNIQTSLVRWRSSFEIRVNGTEGYGVVSGKGRSFGCQTYIRGKKWGWQNGKSQKDSEELVIADDCSNSFYDEMRSLLNQVGDNCTAYEGLRNMKLYNECLKVTT